jgi:hypothetical protein
MKPTQKLSRKLTQSLLLASLGWLAACTPTVQLAAPKEPITINLNVRIDHEVRVKVDQELDAAFASNPDLF